MLTFHAQNSESTLQQKHVYLSVNLLKHVSVLPGNNQRKTNNDPEHHHWPFDLSIQSTTKIALQ